MAVFRKYRKYAGKNRKYFSRKPSVKKALRSVRAKSFRKKVLSVIHKEAENKTCFWAGNLTAYNSGINSTGDINQLIGSIQNGSQDHQRIGDEVRAMKLSIRGHVIMAINNTVNDSPTRRIAVRMMVVQPRRYSCINDVQTNASTWTSYLLKKGNTQTAFTGTISDLYADINTDEIITYYDKRMYLNQPYIDHQGSTTDRVIDVSKTVKFFNINLKCRNKKLRYDVNNDSGLTPTNYCPVLIIGYCHLDGGSADVLSTQVSMAYDSTLYFEDL